MHPALEIPEVLSNIFGWLQSDRRALHSVIQQNRRWFDCGTAMLWANQPPHQALAAVRADRQEMYACKIRHWSFNGDEDRYHPQFRSMEFSSLRTLSLDACSIKNRSVLPIRQYLHPPLEKLNIYGGNLDVQLLDHIATTCRRLGKLLIDSPGPYLRPESFLAFLIRCPSLQHMDFLHSMDHLITHEIMSHFARRENLLGLGVSLPITDSLLCQLLDETREPFRSLLRLNCRIHPPALPLLAATLSNLTDLSFTVLGDKGSHRILQEVASLTQLTRLVVVFNSGQEAVSKADMLALTNLGQLEVLDLQRLCNTHWRTFNVDDFGKRDFALIASHLPRLRHLTFHGLADGRALEILEAIGKSCRLLETCNIYTDLSIVYLQSLPCQTGTLAFPHLEELTVGTVVAPTIMELTAATANNEAGKSKAHELASLLPLTFPSLAEFDAHSGDLFSRAIQNAFAEIKTA